MTDVLIRKAKDSKALVALLPQIPGNSPAMCMAIDADGQPMSVEPEAVTLNTWPADTKDHARMRNVLREAGYEDVRVRLRLHRQDAVIRSGATAIAPKPENAPTDAVGAALAALLQRMVDEAVERAQTAHRERVKAAMMEAIKL